MQTNIFLVFDAETLSVLRFIMKHNMRLSVQAQCSSGKVGEANSGTLPMLEAPCIQQIKCFVLEKLLFHAIPFR